MAEFPCKASDGSDSKPGLTGLRIFALANPDSESGIESVPESSPDRRVETKRLEVLYAHAVERYEATRTVSILCLCDGWSGGQHREREQELHFRQTRA